MKKWKTYTGTCKNCDKDLERTIVKEMDNSHLDKLIYLKCGNCETINYIPSENDDNKREAYHTCCDFLIHWKQADCTFSGMDECLS